MDDLISRQADVTDINVGDLISRQEALDAIYECWSSDYDSEYECGYDDGLKQGIHRLKHLPTIDAVPVVRCRDCKNLERIQGHLGEYTECRHFDCDVAEDGFCAWGERKDDE